MRRDPALIGLSHDHHHALVVARSLRRAHDSASAETARRDFVGYWHAAGSSHFELEEQVLLPAFGEYADLQQPLVLRMLSEHDEIRRSAARLANGDAVPVAELVALGTTLAEHVRMEERELFPLIEATLPPDRLASLAGALHGRD